MEIHNVIIQSKENVVKQVPKERYIVIGNSIEFDQTNVKHFIFVNEGDTLILEGKFADGTLRQEKPIAEDMILTGLDITE